MRKSVMMLAILAILSSSLAYAKPPAKKHVVHAVKITDVWICPITLDKVNPKKQAGDPVVVGHYRAHFCCGSCPPAFAKLTPKEKMTKILAAYKKEFPAKKKAAKKA